MPASVLARVLVFVAAVALLGMGAASAGGLIALSTTASPTLSSSLTYNGTGELVVLHIHIKALPKDSMYVYKIVADYGGAKETYYPGSTVTGYYTVTRDHTFPASGTYAINATVYATDSGYRNGTAYQATAATITVTTPLPGSSGGCTTDCPSVSSAFTVSSSGLGITVVDASTVENASVSSIVWSFGDGGTGSGSTATHTYAGAGTFFVTETVNVLGANGQSATASSSANVTVPSGGCAGTSGSCGSSSSSALSGLLIPLFLGAGAGLLVAAVLWRWEAVIAVAGGVGLGLAYGAFTLGFL